MTPAILLSERIAGALYWVAGGFVVGGLLAYAAAVLMGRSRRSKRIIFVAVAIPIVAIAVVIAQLKLRG